MVRMGGTTDLKSGLRPTDHRVSDAWVVHLGSGWSIVFAHPGMFG